MTDIAWPLVAYIADGRCITEAEAAAIVDALRVPAPAVPDDVAETAKRLRQATFTKGRMHCGIIGQTIEAAMRSTVHEVSAWDLTAAADALEAQAAELARLTDKLELERALTDGAHRRARALDAAPPAPDAVAEALSDMIAVAEQDGWDKSMSGRQIIIRNAREALAKGPSA